jgi:peroxiredoxin
MFLFVLLGAALVALNVGLVVQNRTLKAAAAGGGGSRAIVLPPGKSVPALAGLDSEGRQLVFDYGSDPRKTLLLVFSPRCPYCTKNMPNWNALTLGLDEKEFRVVAVSTVPDGVKEYAEKHGLNNIPVITTPDPKDKVAYEMNVTPQTVLIGPDGTVEKVWTGLIQGAERDDIQKYLGVSLPALAAR